MEKDQKIAALAQRGVERADNRVTEGNQTEFGDTTNEQVAFPACGAPDVKCDNMKSALKLVTNWIKM